jgi:Trk K+ transport system NAD-binding subunit
VLIAEEQPIDTGEATIMVAGMGRLGAGAYDCMRRIHGDTVIGIDSDGRVVEEQEREGRQVVLGDVTDCDFWERTGLDRIKLLLLTLPTQTENIAAIEEVKCLKFRGSVAVTAQFPDEVEALKAAGADAAFNFYAEAGSGFAQHVSDQLGDKLEEVP